MQCRALTTPIPATQLLSQIVSLFGTTSPKMRGKQSRRLGKSGCESWMRKKGKIVQLQTTTIEPLLNRKVGPFGRVSGKILNQTSKTSKNFGPSGDVLKDISKILFPTAKCTPPRTFSKITVPEKHFLVVNRKFQFFRWRPPNHVELLFATKRFAIAVLSKSQKIFPTAKEGGG
jgi:hypothetical protein